jgi:glycosyltransferase involved in cell wall biosynthesis
LSCFYIDNYNYQENILPKLNKADGHDVLIIASTETYIDNSELGYVSPKSYETEYGVPIIRVPYHKIFSFYLSKKIRKYIGVYDLIEKFNPDVILFHGTCAYELLTVSKYVSKHQEVKLYVDSHEDYHNSARNFLSKYVLHKLLYKRFLKKSLRNIEKIFYLTYEIKLFLEEMYNSPAEKMEYYPIGGIIIEEKERREKRENIRSFLKLEERDILLLHSGKMDKLKRTEDIIKALSYVNNQNIKLLIIGSMADDIKDQLMVLINADERISYIGWKSANELLEYICACDLYVQPGGQSVTMQMAVCSGTAVALYPHDSHIHLLGDSAFYIKKMEDINELLNKIVENPDTIEDKRKQSFSVACKKLDYKVLAERLYQ